jgi:hypothetical protein
MLSHAAVPLCVAHGKLFIDTGTARMGSTAASPAAASKPNPWYPDHAVFDATKDQLTTMPEFKYTTE